MGQRVLILCREFELHVRGKGQIQVEKLKMENKQIKRAQNNSYGRKIA